MKRIKSFKKQKENTKKSFEKKRTESINLLKAKMAAVVYSEPRLLDLNQRLIQKV
jgi:hypothetical protein